MIGRRRHVPGGDALPQHLSLGRRCNAEVILQQPGAGLVLAQRKGALASGGQCRHQLTVRRFAQRIECHEPLSGLDPGHPGFHARQLLEQPRRCSRKPRPLPGQPVLEGFFVHRGVGQELAAAQRGCGPQRVEVLASGGLENRQGIDGTGAGPQDDLVVDLVEGRWRAGLEFLAQPRQRLPQAVARRIVVVLAPQQAGEPLAWCALAGRHGEDGEKGAVLPAGDGKGRTCAARQGKVSHQPQAQFMRRITWWRLSHRRPSGLYTGQSRSRQFL